MRPFGVPGKAAVLPSRRANVAHLAVCLAMQEVVGRDVVDIKCDAMNPQPWP